jgi:hypothetical protein
MDTTLIRILIVALPVLWVLGVIFLIHSKKTAPLIVVSALGLVTGLGSIVPFSILLHQSLQDSQACAAASGCLDESGSLIIFEAGIIVFGSLILVLGIIGLIKLRVNLRKKKP